MTDFTWKWKCCVCKKRADYKANKFFLCRTHWRKYLDNPESYLKQLEQEVEEKK